MTSQVEQKAFTLIEVLIGLVILAAIILAVAAMQVTSIKGGHFSNNLTQATILAQDKLEYLRNVSYSGADLSAGLHNEGLIPDSIFSREYSIGEESGNSMKMITVVVRWADPREHSISVSTIKSK